MVDHHPDSYEFLQASGRVKVPGYHIVTPDFYNATRHGKTEDSSPGIESYYLVDRIVLPETLFRWTYHKFKDTLWGGAWNEDAWYNPFTAVQSHQATAEAFVNLSFNPRRRALNISPNSYEFSKKYKKVIFEKGPMAIYQVHIAMVIDLPAPGLERVCILKTHWLRLIQRKWKKIFKQRLNVMKLRCNPKNQKYRNQHGFYPKSCNDLPVLKGMLSDLSRGR